MMRFAKAQSNFVAVQNYRLYYQPNNRYSRYNYCSSSIHTPCVRGLVSLASAKIHLHLQAVGLLLPQLCLVLFADASKAKYCWNSIRMHPDDPYPSNTGNIKLLSFKAGYKPKHSHRVSVDQPNIASSTTVQNEMCVTKCINSTNQTLVSALRVLD